jgi:proteic killer suppression protein
MIRSFRRQGTEDIFHGKQSKAARQVCPQNLWDVATRKLDQLNAAAQLKDLAAPPHNHLEPLEGRRKGQHSIRINRQYRVCFYWTEGGPEAVEITDYH